MRRPSFVLAVAAIVFVPAIAFAANGPAVLDLTSGVPNELLGKTLGLARRLWVFCFVLALILEAFGSSPTRPRDYGGCVWRSLVVLALLAGYPRVFGSVINLAEGVADSITPYDVQAKFAKKNTEYIEKLYAQKSADDEKAERAADPSGLSTDASALAKFAGNYVGGMFFDSLLGSFVLVGQAAHWVVASLARILATVFYLLGPLALVFAVPKGSPTGGAWLRNFVTVASWPIFSGMILAITASFLFKGYETQGVTTAFGAVASALLLIVTAFAVPSLASSVIGGGGNLIAEGAQNASSVARRVMPTG